MSWNGELQLLYISYSGLILMKVSFFFPLSQQIITLSGNIPKKSLDFHSERYVFPQAWDLCHGIVYLNMEGWDITEGGREMRDQC
jgi:hypothetical protein